MATQLLIGLDMECEFASLAEVSGEPFRSHSPEMKAWHALNSAGMPDQVAELDHRLKAYEANKNRGRLAAHLLADIRRRL